MGPPSRAQLYGGLAVAGYACYAVYRRWARGVPLAGAKVVISGASAGIGAALGKECATRGATVYLLARNVEALEAVAAEINASSAKGSAIPLQCDCAEANQVATILAEVGGAPDVLINNAGAGAWRYLNEAPAGDVAFCMSAPYGCAALLSRALMPAMLRSRKKSAVVIVQSPAALCAVPGATAYSCARWALRGLFEALTNDCYGSSVNIQMAVFGEVSSSYFTTNAGAKDRLPKISDWLVRPLLAPEDAAAVAADQIESGRSVVFAPFMLRVVAVTNHLWPQAVRILAVATSPVTWRDFAAATCPP